MSLKIYGWELLYALLLAGATMPATSAQIVPDRTLPTNSVVSPGCLQCIITGGTTQQQYLFHSFQTFSVPTGGVAWFNHAAGIHTILARVTGGQPSTINGLITANGAANLFFINPSGILFGPNAQLNLGGSFLASTASSFHFASGGEFSAVQPQAPPLLTMNMPIGLQFGPTPGAIANQSQAKIPGFAQPVGLAVRPGQTLALIGGDVTLNGGNLTAFGGRVDVGSVQANGQATILPGATGFQVAYPAVQAFGAIQLNQGAEINTSGFPGGPIQLQGRSLALAENARIVSFNFGNQPGGAITVNATEAVELTGVGNYAQRLQELASGTLDPAVVRNVIATLSAGPSAAGDVIINTQRLTLQDGAAIASVTGGAGAAGNSIINASESVELSASPFFNGTFVRSTGAGGDLTINTKRLVARDNAEISTATFGTGKGGNLTVNATDSIELVGAVPIPAPALNGVFVTGIFANGAAPGGGEAGNLRLSTGRLVVTDGAQVGADTNNSVTQGGGGNITVQATEAIVLTGRSPGTNAPSLITASGVNQGGTIAIATPRLTLQNGAGVSVRSNDSAGNIEIAAQLFRLDNQAFLEATSRLGAGGNIRIQAGNLILRRNSTISTSAGLVGGSGSGGNIRINATFVIADLTENSDIRANAFAGSGGRIDITALGVYGLRFRPLETQFSDITVSSQLGISGTFTINTLNTDPNRGLVTLPVNLVDPSDRIATGCAPSRTAGNNKFVVTGRGGLPTRPEEWGGDRPLVAPTELAHFPGVPASPVTNASPATKIHGLEPAPLTEAQGWAIATDGSIYLVAQTATATEAMGPPTPPCQFGP